MKIPVSMFSRLVGGMLLAASIISATLVTTSTNFGTIEDFNSRGGAGYNFTTGPVLLPSGVVFTADVTNTNFGAGAVLGQGQYGLGINGNWGGDRVYAGVNSANNAGMVFTMPFLVNGVGALMNYCPNCGTFAIIEAIDSGGGVLESYDLFTAAPINTPGGFNASEFRGIFRDAGDIAALRLRGSYLIADDLTFTIPEPGTVTLLGAGLGLLLLLRRRWLHGLANVTQKHCARQCKQGVLR